MFLEVIHQKELEINSLFKGVDIEKALYKRVMRFLERNKITMKKSTNQSNVSPKEQGKVAGKFLRNNLRITQDFGILPGNR